MSKFYQVLVVLIALLATIACSSGETITEATGDTDSGTTPVATSTPVQQMATQAATAAVTQTAATTQTAAVTQTTTQVATRVATPIATAAPPVDLTSIDAVCETRDGYIYCLSTVLAAPSQATIGWGELSGVSPEVFCATDITTEVCEWMTRGLLAAISRWGNYAPVEYWVLGADYEAYENLTAINCARRIERGQMRQVDCDRKHGPGGNHGFYSYWKLGSDSIASGRPGGSAGLNGDRNWGVHFFTASLPVALTDYFEVSGLEEQKTLHHEYFHGVQHAHIFTKDRNQRDELLGPVWFNEGAAEYMAQVAVKEGRASVLIDMVKTEGRWSFEFTEQMQQKMQSWERNSLTCPGLKLKDMTYQNSCNGSSYDLGVWAHAYLANKYGTTILMDTFYPMMNDVSSWEEAFVATYGINSDDFLAEFDTFLELSLSEQVKILP